MPMRRWLGPTITAWLISRHRGPPTSTRVDTWQKVLTDGHASLVGARAVSATCPSGRRDAGATTRLRSGGSTAELSPGSDLSRKNPTLCSSVVTPCRPAARRSTSPFCSPTSVVPPPRRARLGGRFRRAVNRFYATATRVLLRHDAIIDKLIGDEVMAFSVRGVSGPDYRRRAVLAARELLEAVGCGSADGPWFRLGWRSTRESHAGNVGEAVVDFTALGDPVNVAARMQQHAAGGELTSRPGWPTT